MAKKLSGGGGLIAIAILFSMISAAYEWVVNNLYVVVLIIGLSVATWVAIAKSRSVKRQREHAAWVASLQRKYVDREIVNAIVNGRYWIGQTQEQLTDSLGSPEGVDRKVLKTKTKEVWKYRQVRKGQFALRINVEDGVVSGWDKKDS